MTFNWQRFLDQHHIEYTGDGWLTIACPFCGRDDPSQHMNIDPRIGGYHCWRNHDHRGRNPIRLVHALINCTWEQAQAIVGNDLSIPDDFLSRIRSQLSSEVEEPTRAIDMPDAFRAFKGSRPSAQPYIRYLHERGFKDAELLSRRYGLRYCNRGAFKGRIVFPVHLDGQLLNWTGRTIFPWIDLRYKTLSSDPDKAARNDLPVAGRSIGELLLWFDDLMTSDADHLCICEGPFDALKLSELGRAHGIVATCFFTSAPSHAQCDLLHTIIPRYRKCTLLLDQGTLPNMLRITSALASLHVGVATLPLTMKDPGELRTGQQLLKILT